MDGGEGSGKDHHIARLRARPDMAHVVFTREPGGTPAGEVFRDILLHHPEFNLRPETELFLFSAGRAQLMREVIIPALLRGAHALSNRGFLSTIAYQLYGRRQPERVLNFFLKATQFALSDGTNTYFPDMYILLDVPPEIGLARKKPAERNRFEAEALDFHRRVREGFLRHIGEMGRYAVIDTNRDAETVAADILAAVRKTLAS